MQQAAPPLPGRPPPDGPAPLLPLLPAPAEGLEGTPAKRDRVAAKFVEAEFEKCDRLLEVYFRYAARVSAGEQR